MIKTVVQKILEKAYPNRNFEAAKIGKRLYIIQRDCLDSLSYSLQGIYPYKEVKELNELTTYSAIFGYCPLKGPIAIIGVPTPMDWKYFKEVTGYGEINDNEALEFKKESEENAKRIANYTVYGLKGIREIADFVKFDKIIPFYDSRHWEAKYSHEPRVLKMKCQLEGKYSYNQAEALARTQQCWAVDRGMAYATLENGQHVAIMSFWYDKKDEATGFRDVWESGKPEPSIQKITFMPKDEAVEITDFSMYLYDYEFLYKPRNEPPIIKIDRTLTPGFDFYDTPDGKDLRLFGHI